MTETTLQNAAPPIPDKLQPAPKASRAPTLRLLPLVIFCALLMLSVRVKDIFEGVLSLDVGVTTPVQAQQPVEPTDLSPIQPRELPSSSAVVKAPPPGETGEQLFTPAELEILQNLSQRRDDLESRAKELDMREGLLKAAESRIDTKIVELKGLQASIDDLLRRYDEQEEAKMASLVKIYETMKPKDAARIFEELDMPILLEVVERMKEQKVAPILASMDPLKAKSLTSEMALRRQMPAPVAQVGG